MVVVAMTLMITRAYDTMLVLVMMMTTSTILLFLILNLVNSVHYDLADNHNDFDDFDYNNDTCSGGSRNFQMGERAQLIINIYHLFLNLFI